MRRRVIMTVLIALGVLCALIIMLGLVFQKNIYDRIMPRDRAAIAEHFFDLMASGDIDGVKARMDPRGVNATTRPTLEKISSYLGKTPPAQVEVIGANIQFGPNGFTSIALQYHYLHPERWVAAELTYTGDSFLTATIVNFNVVPLSDSLEHQNRLTFERKGIANIVAALAGILLAAGVIWTLVVCARTPMKRRRWLWVIFILMGLTTLQFDWTTAETRFLPISFQLFSASLVRTSPYSPWILGLSIPVGAIAFWIGRPFMLRNAVYEATKADTDLPPAGEGMLPA